MSLYIEVGKQCNENNSLDNWIRKDNTNHVYFIIIRREGSVAEVIGAEKCSQI